MPAESKAQAGMMGAELARRRKGRKPRMDMKTADLEEFLRGVEVKDLPARKLGKALKRRRK